MTEQQLPLMLEGVRVVDLTQYLAGPTTTRLMAELGADIVKVEQAPGGDPGRTLPVMKDGRSIYFIQQNRGKKSFCVDFSKEESAEVIRDLVRHADVVVENMGPGVLEKRGLDYQALKEVNPGLVMVSISAFGRNSPLSNRVGYDLIAQAFSGMMHMTGDPDGPPQFVGFGIADVNAGVHALTALGLALFHKERTGVGQWIDLSMIDAIYHQMEMAVHGPPATDFRMNPTRGGHQSALTTPCGAFKSPGGYIVVLALDRQWENVVNALGMPELLEDERFETLRSRGKNRDVLIPIIEEWMAEVGSDEEILEILEKHRVPAAPVLSPAQTHEHEYFAAREMIRTVHDPYAGDVVIPGYPFKFSEYPELPELVAPTLGEHNRSTLEGIGYSAERIAELEANGVLHEGGL